MQNLKLKKIDTVFFEPWSLGDVIIAAAIIRECPSDIALACNPKWHTLLTKAFENTKLPTLLSVSLPYTDRNKCHKINLNTSIMKIDGVSEVINIRGDFRDFIAACKIFPRAKIRITGWIPFMAWRMSLVDYVFSKGLCPVKNRYKIWADLMKIPFEKIEKTYQQKQSNTPKNGRIIIHIGAQWKSRQYPFVSGLEELFVRKGYEVIIIAGLNDSLPEGICESSVVRAINGKLVDELLGAQMVIVNDSGPMHLAAFLGCKTLVVGRVSNLAYWIPPATPYVETEFMPKGYKPDSRYMSDKVIEGWPDIYKIIESGGL